MSRERGYQRHAAPPARAQARCTPSSRSIVPPAADDARRARADGGRAPGVGRQPVLHRGDRPPPGGVGCRLRAGRALDQRRPRIEDLGIPRGIRDAIDRRLSRLTDGVPVAAATASVFGYEFRLTLAAPHRRARHGASCAAASLEAVDAAVLAQHPEDPGVVPVRPRGHPRRALRHGAAGRRATLHRSIGEALEDHYARPARAAPRRARSPLRRRPRRSVSPGPRRPTTRSGRASGPPGSRPTRTRRTTTSGRCSCSGTATTRRGAASCCSTLGDARQAGRRRRPVPPGVPRRGRARRGDRLGRVLRPRRGRVRRAAGRARGERPRRRQAAPAAAHGAADAARARQRAAGAGDEPPRGGAVARGRLRRARRDEPRRRRDGRAPRRRPHHAARPLQPAVGDDGPDGVAEGADEAAEIVRLARRSATPRWSSTATTCGCTRSCSSATSPAWTGSSGRASGSPRRCASRPTSGRSRRSGRCGRSCEGRFNEGEALGR